MSQQLTKKQQEEQALVLQDAMMEGFEEDAGSGLEEADKDSYAVPFIRILQKLSPQVDEDSGEYIPGARVGMFYNTVTGEVMPEVKVLPCYFRRTFIEWKPKRGGFVGEHNASDPVVDTAEFKETEDGKMVNRLPNGNDLADTRMHYVLLIREDDSFSPAIIALSSTQIKKSKTWVAKMGEIKFRRKDGTLFNPPTYSHYYTITSKDEENDQGKWKGWVIGSPQMITNIEHAAAAKEFKELVRSGQANVDYDKMNDTDTSEDDNTEY